MFHVAARCMALVTTNAEVQEAWTGHCRLLATAASTCTSLHAVLLGPDAGPLWRHQLLCGSYPGVSGPQRLQMHRLLARQGHHARSVYILGADWDTAELEQSLASLTGLKGRLELHGIDSPAQAACYVPLLSSPVTCLVYQGSQELLGPLCPTLRCVNVTLSSGGPAQYLDCLRPLADLHELTLWAPKRRLCSLDAQLLASQHPHLTQLRLTLAASSHIKSDDVRCLRSLPACLSLVVMLQDRNSFSSLLRQLQETTLEVLDLYRLSPLTTDHEELLAHLAIQVKLVLRSGSPTWRLARQLPGVSVEYKPL